MTWKYKKKVLRLFAPCTAAVKQYSTAGVDEPFISKTTDNIEQKTFLDQNFVFCAIHQNIDQKFNSPIQFAAHPAPRSQTAFNSCFMYFIVLQSVVSNNFSNTLGGDFLFFWSKDLNSSIGLGIYLRWWHRNVQIIICKAFQ